MDEDEKKKSAGSGLEDVYLAQGPWDEGQPYACQVAGGKAGATPADMPEVLERLGMRPTQWCGLIRDFGRIFSLVAGLPSTLKHQRGRRTQRPFHTRRRFRELFATTAV